MDCWVELRRQPGAVPMRSVVDEADLPLVEQHGPWYLSTNQASRVRAPLRYAVARTKRGDKDTLVRMHTVLTGWSFVDHKDGDGLNNHRSNLRQSTAQQNCWNSRPHLGGSSFYKGVSWNRRDQRWYVKVTASGKTTFVGVFKDEEEAARAYDAAAVLLHGEFAWLNFPHLIGDIHA